MPKDSFMEVGTNMLFLSGIFSGISHFWTRRPAGNLACIARLLFFLLPAPLYGSESIWVSVSSSCLIAASCQHLKMVVLGQSNEAVGGCCCLPCFPLGLSSKANWEPPWATSQSRKSDPAAAACFFQVCKKLHMATNSISKKSPEFQPLASSFQQLKKMWPFGGAGEKLQKAKDSFPGACQGFPDRG